MLMTITELRPSEVGSRYPYTELCFHLNVSGSPDILLQEFIAELARRNEPYRLGGDKCRFKCVRLAYLSRVRRVVAPAIEEGWGPSKLLNGDKGFYVVILQYLE